MSEQEELRKYIAEGTIVIKNWREVESGKDKNRSGGVAIPVPVLNKFDLKGGEQLVFFDQEGYMNLPSGVANSTEWIFIAIRRKVKKDDGNGRKK